MMSTATMEKPATVVAAIRLFYLVIALGIARAAFMLMRHADLRSPDFLILTKFRFYAVCIFLIKGLAKGRNWTRWTLTALLTIDIPLAVLPAFDGISLNPLDSGLLL